MDNTIQIRWVGLQISETKYMPKHQPEQGCQVGTWLTRVSSRGFIHVYTQFLYLWRTDQHNTMRPPTVLLLPKKACMAVKCGTVANSPTHRLLQYCLLYSLLGRVQRSNGWSRSTYSTIDLVWYA